MGVNGIESTGGSNDGGFRDMAARRHQEATFEQLVDVDVNQPRHEPDHAPRHGGEARFESKGFHEPQGDDHGRGGRATDEAAEHRQDAVELRQEAEDLRQQASEVEENGEGAHMRQVYLDRAESKELDAVAADKRAEAAEARAADREEDRRLNGGDEGFEPVEEYGGVEEEVIPRDQDALPVEGWAPLEQVTAYTQELNAIDGFEDLEVTDTREATDNEVEAFLDLAEELGLENRDFAEGFLQAFPVQFVYVEDLEAQGFDTATLGEVLFDNKTIILMDSEYAMDDITLDTSPAGEAARENAELSYTSIIDVMIEMEAVETAAMPSSLGMETMDESEEEDEATTQTAGLSSAPVSGTSDTDADPDE